MSNEINTRDYRSNDKQVKDQYAVNYNIKNLTVRLIDSNGVNLGIMPTRDALTAARSEMLDLVLINASVDPPVASICDYGKFIYEAKRHKKESDRKIREHMVRTKEIQIRLNITNHDLDIKIQHAIEWLEDNCKVKIVVKFKGRELTYKNRGFDIVNGFVEKLDCKIEKAPNINNNTIIAIVAPGPKIAKVTKTI